MATILLAEDEPSLLATVGYSLRREGYDVLTATNGEAALALAGQGPDLVILDVMLSKLDGFEVCRRLRQRSSVPIMMLTAKVDEVDRVVGLELGADDYLTKPFSMRELLARVKALLRRRELLAAPIQRDRDTLAERKQRVLFLCIHNSARSQMAEGWLRHLAGDRFEAHSAGVQATAVRPLAIRAMQEAGIDISGQHSRSLEEYLGQAFDWVVTVCDEAAEACPTFPGAAERLHWPLPDPAAAKGSEEEQVALYREVRDALRAALDTFLVRVARPAFDNR